MELDAVAQKQFIEEKDNVFLTQEQKNAAANNAGAVLDGPADQADAFKQASLIPISHTDVHKFIQEISGDNLQLINFTDDHDLETYLRRAKENFQGVAGAHSR